MPLPRPALALLLPVCTLAAQTRLLREGAISQSDIEKVIPTVVIS